MNVEFLKLPLETVSKLALEDSERSEFSRKNKTLKCFYNHFPDVGIKFYLELFDTYFCVFTTLLLTFALLGANESGFSTSASPCAVSLCTGAVLSLKYASFKIR